MSSGQEPTPPSLFGLVQNWEKLLFMHWEVPAERLRALIPPQLSVDTFRGRAFVSITPFRLTGFRETYVPAIPGFSDFYEINCRTYVTLGGEHGVWFFSLDASRLFAVLGARIGYSLPYYHADIEMEESAGAIRYRMKRISEPAGRGYFRVTYKPTGDFLDSSPGTLGHFLTERSVLYAATSGFDAVYRARVHHAPGELQAAMADDFATDLFDLAGVGVVEAGPVLHYWERKEVQADLPERCA
jgi:uncharacterized protein